MHVYFRLIVINNFPLCFVANDEMRKVSKFSVKTGHETFVKVLLKVVEFVTNRQQSNQIVWEFIYVETVCRYQGLAA